MITFHLQCRIPLAVSIGTTFSRMRGTEINLIITLGLTAVLATNSHLMDDDVEEDNFLLLPGTNCEESPPCPDGKKCEMIEPPCYSRICDTDLVPACVYSVFGPKSVTDEDEYIRLPGTNCDDAPPCPDERTCVMEEPKCYSRRCDHEPVPTCAFKSRY